MTRLPKARLLAPALAAALTMGLAAALPAQVLYDQFDDSAETATVTGAYKRYQTHVLKLSAHRYAVLFRPGYVDAATAIRTVTPLCAAQGRSAAGTGDMAPVDLVLEDGQHSVLQGYRVVCQ